jgi:hypothetical protein
MISLSVIQIDFLSFFLLIIINMFFIDFFLVYLENYSKGQAPVNQMLLWKSLVAMKFTGY